MRPIIMPVTRAASIKDVLESFGLPHTEVERIACNGRTTDFSHRVEAGQQFDVYPIPSPWDITTPTLLRPNPPPSLRFIVDVNVGRLARYLRMAGFDTRFNPSWDALHLLEAMAADPGILLTRNLDLLKRKQVVFGRYVRATEPVAQLREMLALFAGVARPETLTRCLDCNTPLLPIAKQAILHRLEPLTVQYFEAFSTCPRCDTIYWAGSHVDRMQRSLAQALGRPASA